MHETGGISVTRSAADALAEIGNLGSIFLLMPLLPTVLCVSAQSNFFMKHFDIDGDGLISFHEYLLIVTLLSIPLKVRIPKFLE